MNVHLLLRQYWIHFYNFGLHFVVLNSTYYTLAVCEWVSEWECAHSLARFFRILFPFLLCSMVCMFFFSVFSLAFLVSIPRLFLFRCFANSFSNFILYRCILSHIFPVCNFSFLLCLRAFAPSVCCFFFYFFAVGGSVIVWSFFHSRLCVCFFFHSFIPDFAIPLPLHRFSIHK